MGTCLGRSHKLVAQLVRKPANDPTVDLPGWRLDGRHPVTLAPNLSSAAAAGSTRAHQLSEIGGCAQQPCRHSNAEHNLDAPADTTKPL
jgi:hypothetical protein